MEKYIILRTDGRFIIVIHAAPNCTGKFQWYLVDEPNSDNVYILDNQVFESILISSEDICNKYQNKWLCCKCEVENDNYNEGCVCLLSDFIEMISTNQFDVINFFDKNGNIRNNISYRNPINVIQ